MDSARFVEIIAEHLRVNALETEDGFEFQSMNDAEANRLTPLKLDEINVVLDQVNEFKRDENSGLMYYTSHFAEIAVDTPNSIRPIHMRGDLVFEDQARGLKYELGRPSTAFSAAILEALSAIPPRERPIRPFMHYNRYSNEAPQNPLSLLSEMLRISTLRISSTDQKVRTEWASLAESFYFHLGYNLDYAIVPRQGISDLTRSGRIQRLRRSHPDDMEAPKRVYIPELVRSYQVALSSESAMLSFLSFYHVAEHWFEDVFLDDIASRVQATITSPGFSAKRKKDLRNLIRTVSKSLRSRDDEVVINELTGLELTLNKYVDLGDLSESLRQFDSSLLDYYSSERVPFSEGDHVDLTDNNKTAVTKALAQRIYKTRNTLAHRKDREKQRFTPFKDDASLRRELPLMRFIAEQIVISSSSLP